jgi:radical SAM protein with 4Fe4S-binding SPASM domain
MVTTKESLKYPNEIIDEYVKLGFVKIQLKPLTYLEKAKLNWKKVGYTPEQFLEFWTKSMDHIIDINLKGKLFVESISYYILIKILTNRNANFLDLQSPCGAAIGQLAYDYDGSIYTCDEGRNFDFFKLGHVNTDSYKDILTSDRVCAMIGFSVNENYICDNCIFRPYCGLCPVCEYSKTKNPITNVPESDRCKIFMGIFNYLFEKLKDKKIKKVFQNWADSVA